MRRRFFRCLLGIALASISIAASWDEAPIRSPITRQAVIAQINEHRAANQLPPLREDERLVRAAEARMRDMVEQEYWSHDAPDGRPPFTWLEPNGYPYRNAAENLARGFETAELLVDSWMESPGHRSNILGGEFSDVGIAILDGATTGRAAGRSVVVLFGRE